MAFTYVAAISLQNFPQNPNKLLSFADATAFGFCSGYTSFSQKDFDEDSPEWIHHNRMRGI